MLTMLKNVNDFSKYVVLVGPYFELNFIICDVCTQWARKLKKFTKIFFDQIPIFGISKMAKNQFLNWEKV